MPANTQENSSVLTVQEQAVCKQIAAKGEAPHSQRAQALLALNSGVSQEDAGQQSGLTAAQVRYWQGRFRTRRLSIFPDDVLDSAKTEPPGEPEEKPVAAKEQPEVKQSEPAKPTKPAEKTAPVEEKPEVAEKPEEELKAEKATKKDKEPAAKTKDKKDKEKKKKRSKKDKKLKAKKDKAKKKAEKKSKKKKEKNKKAKAAKKSKKKKNKKSKK